MCGCGGVEDGHGEKVRESQKQVHYDYKNLLGGMMRKFSWILLVLLVLVGCGDEPVLVEKGVKAKNITWDKDEAEMVLIPAGSFQMGAAKNEPEEWMQPAKPVHTVELDAFYMDVHEVTVGQFRDMFVRQSGYKYSGNWDKVANRRVTSIQWWK